MKIIPETRYTIFHAIERKKKIVGNIYQEHEDELFRYSCPTNSKKLTGYSYNPSIYYFEQIESMNDDLKEYCESM